MSELTRNLVENTTYTLSTSTSPSRKLTTMLGDVAYDSVQRNLAQMNPASSLTRKAERAASVITWAVGDYSTINAAKTFDKIDFNDEYMTKLAQVKSPGSPANYLTNFTGASGIRQISDFTAQYNSYIDSANKELQKTFDAVNIEYKNSNHDKIKYTQADIDKNKFNKVTDDQVAQMLKSANPQERLFNMSRSYVDANGNKQQFKYNGTTPDISSALNASISPSMGRNKKVYAMQQIQSAGMSYMQNYGSMQLKKALKSGDPNRAATLLKNPDRYNLTKEDIQMLQDFKSHGGFNNYEKAGREINRGKMISVRGIMPNDMYQGYAVAKMSYTLIKSAVKTTSVVALKTAKHMSLSKTTTKLPTLKGSKFYVKDNNKILFYKRYGLHINTQEHQNLIRGRALSTAQKRLDDMALDSRTAAVLSKTLKAVRDPSRYNAYDKAINRIKTGRKKPVSRAEARQDKLDKLRHRHEKRNDKIARIDKRTAQSKNIVSKKIHQGRSFINNKKNSVNEARQAFLASRMRFAARAARVKEAIKNAKAVKALTAVGGVLLAPLRVYATVVNFFKNLKKKIIKFLTFATIRGLLIFATSGTALIALWVALHYISEPTIENMLNSPNFCQMIASATAEDMGMDFKYIAMIDATDHYLTRKPKENSLYFWYKDTRFGQIEHVWAWEEADNSSFWTNDDTHGLDEDKLYTDLAQPTKHKLAPGETLLYGDTYVKRENRSDVPSSDICANIIPIMSMAHTRYLGHINFKNWETALGYSYYMFSISHDLARYDKRDEDAKTSLYRRVHDYGEKPSDDTPGYDYNLPAPCNNDIIYEEAIDESCYEWDSKEKKPKFTRPTESCSNVYIHDFVDESNGYTKGNPLYDFHSMAQPSVLREIKDALNDSKVVKQLSRFLTLVKQSKTASWVSQKMIDAAWKTFVNLSGYSGDPQTLQEAMLGTGSDGYLRESSAEILTVKSWGLKKVFREREQGIKKARAQLEKTNQTCSDENIIIKLDSKEHDDAGYCVWDGTDDSVPGVDPDLTIGTRKLCTYNREVKGPHEALIERNEDHLIAVQMTDEEHWGTKGQPDEGSGLIAFYNDNGPRGDYYRGEDAPKWKNGAITEAENDGSLCHIHDYDWSGKDSCFFVATIRWSETVTVKTWDSVSMTYNTSTKTVDHTEDIYADDIKEGIFYGDSVTVVGSDRADCLNKISSYGTRCQHKHNDWTAGVHVKASGAPSNSTLNESAQGCWLTVLACGGHCAGHVEPRVNIVEKMTWNGLAMDDGFKTTYWLTIEEITAGDVKGSVTENIAISQYTGVSTGNVEIGNKRPAGLGDLVYKYLDPFGIADSYMEDRLITISEFHAYWHTKTTEWFKPFPRSWFGFYKTKGTTAVQKWAEKIDGVKSFLVEVYTNWKFPWINEIFEDPKDSDTWQSDTKNADDEDDINNFAGWFGTDYEEVHRMDASTESELNAVYGSYFDDKYDYAKKVWEAFGLNFTIVGAHACNPLTEEEIQQIIDEVLANYPGLSQTRIDVLRTALGLVGYCGYTFGGTDPYGGCDCSAWVGAILHQNGLIDGQRINTSSQGWNGGALLPGTVVRRADNPNTAAYEGHEMMIINKMPNGNYLIADCSSGKGGSAIREVTSQYIAEYNYHFNMN